MEFFNDLVRYGYLSHALAACILSGITCGIVGTYVVCRRMVFLAGGITTLRSAVWASPSIWGSIRSQAP